MEDKKVTIKVEDKKDSYLVSITDTGKGIPSDEIPLVWNKYYTKKKNYKRNTVGTGIGLSIVKSVLESHNVEYGIDSKVNKYTTWYAYERFYSTIDKRFINKDPVVSLYEKERIKHSNDYDGTAD